MHGSLECFSIFIRLTGSVTRLTARTTLFWLTSCNWTTALQSSSMHSTANLNGWPYPTWSLRAMFTRTPRRTSARNQSDGQSPLSCRRHRTWRTAPRRRSTRRRRSFRTARCQRAALRPLGSARGSERRPSLGLPPCLHREPFKGADHRNQDRHAVGSIDTTKEQAIEACAKAILRSMGHREIGWEKSDAKDFATKLVTCLEALDLLSKTPFE
jgi:hypothetical protein